MIDHRVLSQNFFWPSIGIIVMGLFELALAVAMGTAKRTLIYDMRSGNVRIERRMCTYLMQCLTHEMGAYDAMLLPVRLAVLPGVSWTGYAVVVGRAHEPDDWFALAVFRKRINLDEAITTVGWPAGVDTETFASAEPLRASASARWLRARVGSHIVP